MIPSYHHGLKLWFSFVVFDDVSRGPVSQVALGGAHVCGSYKWNVGRMWWCQRTCMVDEHKIYLERVRGLLRSEKKYYSIRTV